MNESAYMGYYTVKHVFRCIKACVPKCIGQFLEKQVLIARFEDSSTVHSTYEGLIQNNM
jgi:hypothetical protein